MAPFAGWDMPLWYDSARSEHLAVRTAAGLFDVSHMGQILVEGPDAAKVVDFLVTGDVLSLEPGQALYTPMLNEEGGIVDDLIVYLRSATEVFLCVNASTIDKDFKHIVHNNSGRSVVYNLSDRYGQIALQGPRSKEILARLYPEVAEKLDRLFRFVDLELGGESMLISTTGYTGEWGYELYCPWDRTAEIWEKLMEAGADFGLVPAGLSARDTLRLEAKLCLYGSDITDETNPIEAGLGWTVHMDRPFLGHDKLTGLDKKNLPRKLVGFQMTDGGIPRHGNLIFQGDEEVGIVTSGNRCPSVGQVIGLAYVTSPWFKRNTEFEVEIRDKRKKAIVVKTPFYKSQA